MEALDINILLVTYKIAMKWVIPFALASLAAFGSADVLDLGELDQYNGRMVGHIKSDLTRQC